MITLHWAWFTLIILFSTLILTAACSYTLIAYMARFILETESNRLSEDHVDLEFDKIKLILDHFDYNGDFTYEYEMPSILGYNFNLASKLTEYAVEHDIQIKIRMNSINTIYVFTHKISK